MTGWTLQQQQGTAYTDMPHTSLIGLMLAAALSNDTPLNWLDRHTPDQQCVGRRRRSVCETPITRCTLRRVTLPELQDMLANARSGVLSSDAGKSAVFSTYTDRLYFCIHLNTSAKLCPIQNCWSLLLQCRYKIRLEMLVESQCERLPLVVKIIP